MQIGSCTASPRLQCPTRPWPSGEAGRRPDKFRRRCDTSHGDHDTARHSRHLAQHDTRIIYPFSHAATQGSSRIDTNRTDRGTPRTRRHPLGPRGQSSGAGNCRAFHRLLFDRPSSNLRRQDDSLWAVRHASLPWPVRSQGGRFSCDAPQRRSSSHCSSCHASGQPHLRSKSTSDGPTNRVPSTGSMLT